MGGQFFSIYYTLLHFQNFGQLDVEELLAPIEHLLPKKEEKELSEEMLYSTHLEQTSASPDVTVDASLEPAQGEQQQQQESTISLEESTQPLTSSEIVGESPIMGTESDIVSPGTDQLLLDSALTHSVSAETNQTTDFSLLETTPPPPPPLTVAEGAELLKEGLSNLEITSKPQFYIESSSELGTPSESSFQGSETASNQEA